MATPSPFKHMVPSSTCAASNVCTHYTSVCLRVYTLHTQTHTDHLRRIKPLGGGSEVEGLGKGRFGTEKRCGC